MNQQKTNSKKLALVSIKHMVDKSDYHKAEYYKIYEHLIPPILKITSNKIDHCIVSLSAKFLRKFPLA